jgi:hypothetical protein
MTGVRQQAKKSLVLENCWQMRTSFGRFVNECCLAEAKVAQSMLFGGSEQEDLTLFLHLSASGNAGVLALFVPRWAWLKRAQVTQPPRCVDNVHTITKGRRLIVTKKINAYFSTASLDIFYI